MNDRRDVIGVDLGGTKLAAARLNTEGEILARTQRPTGRHLGNDGLVELVVEAVREVSAGDPFRGVGIGTAGFVRPSAGLIVFSNNLDVRDLPLADEVSSRLDVPVVLDNDLNAIALAEALFGEGRGHEEMVALFVGTGIGGGLVSRQRVFRGASGSAGEAGHQIFIPGGRACHCGQKGCFEAYAAGWALDAMAAEALEEAPSRTRTSHDLRRLADDGSERARILLDDARRALAVLTGNLVTLMNPEVVILGGSVLLGDDDLAEACREGIRLWSTEVARADVDVRMTSLGADSALLGAAALALEIQDGTAT